MGEWDLAEQVLSHCRRRRLEAEVFIQRSRSTTIEVKDKQLQTFKLADDQGIGLRVILGRQQGFAYNTECNSQAVEELIAAAQAGAQNTKGDEYNRLPAPTGSYPELDCYDPRLAAVTVEDKIKRALAVEQAAYACDPRIRRIRQVLYKDIQYQVWVANTRGIRVNHRGSQCAINTMVIAEDNNDAQIGWQIDNSHAYSGLRPAEDIGREAAEKALAMLGARQITTRRSWVVMDPYVCTDFLGMMSSAFSADAVQKGKSLLADKLGTCVASPGLNLVDDGLCKQGMGAAPADGEGVPMQRTMLIDQGRLKSFLHNTYTAHKAGTASTGNGMRDDFKQPPGVGITNLYIEPGRISRRELLAQTKEGLYITQAMGTHTIDPVSGDYSVSVSGHWIEQGEFVHPVRGVVISGNILDLFKNIDLIADDLRFVGMIGSPTIRICDIIISGTSQGLA
jgi:PmbA protein